MKTIILFMAMLWGCGEKLDEKDTRQTYGIEIIDGCEFLYFGGSMGYSHKGNCSNPIHCYCDTLEQKVKDVEYLVTDTMMVQGDSVYIIIKGGSK